MTRHTPLLGALVCIMAYSCADPAPPTPDSHPRLLFDADELEALRARGQHEGWSSITEDWEAVIATYLDEDDLPAQTLEGMPSEDTLWRRARHGASAKEPWPLYRPRARVGEPCHTSRLSEDCGGPQLCTLRRR
jgi:hypothetical protein